MSLTFGDYWNKCCVCGRAAEISAERLDPERPYAKIVADLSRWGERDELRLALLLGVLDSGWYLRDDDPLDLVCPDHATEEDRRRSERFDEVMAAMIPSAALRAGAFGDVHPQNPEEN